MAFESDSLNRRTLGPVIASAVVGLSLGIAAVIGASVFTENPAFGESTSSADQSVLGDPEYGTRR
ncbi:DUF2613 domain-containing protein [Corynebacterium sp. HS2168-gen11]|uniref:DUF2613 domain-containing protein n=1 Tax=Corynebacterium sp. HS2168-gen11 TaxID=2974027 RepID=UPI00216B14F0|nr:DUF2613 domain-containing protein [Corynebacterium sp. HS2168-gen11]MCS4535998.1 DUF2613 domain-containing protein [Corynebacterium sp. HS2168-gen11]